MTYGRTLWTAPPDWSAADQRAIVDWLKAHHVETRTVAKRAVVTGGETPHIHLSVYQTNADGHRYMDLTTGEAVTLPLVVPCRYRPPVLVRAPVVDEQLLALPPVPILDAEQAFAEYPQRVVVGHGQLDTAFLDGQPGGEAYVPRDTRTEDILRESELGG